MNKIKRSGRLFKTAFAILLREKKLLLFPIIATGVGLVIAVFFFAPVALYPTGHPWSSAAHWNAVGERFSQIFPSQYSHHHPESAGFSAGFSGSHAIFQHGWLTLLFAVIYFISMFLGTFCNVAFYHEIMQALSGNTVSIQRGFSFAKTRWRAILLWSLFAGLVGFIIRTIEQRVGFLGKIVTSLIGITWSIASIFIIPTLVRDTETTNPVKLLRYSAGTLKRTWGELVVGFVGMQVAVIFIIIPVMFISMVLPWIIGFSHFVMMPLLMFTLMFLTIMPVTWVKNLVNSVYRCALFIYATEGVIPEPFDKDLLDSAWKVK